MTRSPKHCQSSKARNMLAVKNVIIFEADVVLNIDKISLRSRSSIVYLTDSAISNQNVRIAGPHLNSVAVSRWPLKMLPPMCKISQSVPVIFFALTI